MTREFNQTITCPACDKQFPAETAFCRWMRKERRLDSAQGIVRADFDHLVHRYTRNGLGREFQTLMIVEVKEFMAKPSMSQGDSLALFGQYFRNRSKNMHMDSPKFRQFVNGTGACRLYSKAAKRDVQTRFFGVHVLQFSCTCPEDSDRIFWDIKHQITSDQLIALLRMDLDPDDFQPMEEVLRDRHKREIDLFSTKQSETP